MNRKVILGVVGCMNALLLIDVICHHRFIRQIRFLYRNLYHVALLFCYSIFLISLLVLFAFGLINKCLFKGLSVLQSTSGSASCMSADQCFFRTCLQIYGYWRIPLQQVDYAAILAKYMFHQEANHHKICNTVWL